MTKLSVNINKIAVVRNSRGGNLPDVVRAATDIERFGADGITVHPRPDARHIRYPAGDSRFFAATSPGSRGCAEVEGRIFFSRR